MKLQTYLQKHRISMAEFSRQIGTSANSVRRYCLGRTPKPIYMARIKLVTNNRVKADDFTPDVDEKAFRRDLAEVD